MNSPGLLGSLARTMLSSSEQTRAEARAQLAAMGDAMKADIVKGAAPPSEGRSDPRPLAQAIIGSWTNAMMSVSFAADGSVDATMPGGRQRSGYWSVNASGQLISDVTGGNPIEAWVSGEELTVSMGGTGLTLQRVTR